VGWNTAYDGTGKHIDDEATVQDLTDKSQSNVILFAEWEPIEYDYMTWAVARMLKMLRF
jgi:hypothetical protein